MEEKTCEFQICFIKLNAGLNSFVWNSPSIKALQSKHLTKCAVSSFRPHPAGFSATVMTVAYKTFLMFAHQESETVKQERKTQGWED